MSTRQVGVIMGVAVGLGLCNARQAFAQANPGTVTWVDGWPKKQDSEPPPPMAIPGWIEVFGNYTVNAGWTVTGAWMSWIPQAGGVPQTASLVAQGQKLGAQDPANPNNVIPYRQTVGPGSYTVWMTVKYVRPKPGGGMEFVEVQSSHQNVTIK